ncbi:hypothetical protein EV361DRAFT_910997 [Lentinula raphanica]|uniref:Metal homeostatis protein bsd2 n=1 Tax=Lentinula raphanica TaxID=153919 RepID=A0AA38P2Q0_9AGAR|nr:hypothetical protein F5878DRAFT_567510 [Lentinula raphanica]KAJ3971508.1 hypothetical protein EV361DRAFT_910997 [Lentinula raphanica]
MSNRYAPLPNDPRANQDAQHEMEAAFDDDSDNEDVSESHPLARNIPPPQIHRTPGSYDFENVDYDYPPPGSPPPSRPIPSNFGISDGLITTFDLHPSQTAPRQSWISRALSNVLPSRYSERFGYTQLPHTGVVGGGSSNDGVFANITAKPSRPVTVQEGDDTYVVPEDSRNEAPPTYQSAQADAVPPYWETTVHAPFAPDSIGEMIVDSLPTGSLFSFLWNMLVSVSFQFVGFLLTYLLHTTHAARLGSRAGLGITLIQYGFALRSRLEADAAEENPWADTWGIGNNEKFPTAAEASSNDYYKSYNASSVGNSTFPALTDEQANILVADATTEWLSFFLMTVGWFILLTSLLGFWRVKRWERNIISSQQPAPTDGPRASRSPFENAFGLRDSISTRYFFRQGFGLNTHQDDLEAQAVTNHPEEEIDEQELMQHMNISPDDPDRVRLVAEALANERRLQNDLRAAGLL